MSKSSALSSAGKIFVGKPNTNTSSSSGRGLESYLFSLLLMCKTNDLSGEITNFDAGTFELSGGFVNSIQNFCDNTLGFL